MRSGQREGTGTIRLLQCTVSLVAMLAGCAPSDESAPGASDLATPAVVQPGIDVLLRDSLHLVRNLRVGLITNQTGLTAAGRTSIDVLAESPDIDLVALFSPEHGIRGEAQPGIRVSGTIDESTGLPIRSLYGETRKPTPAMLADIDVLLFDILDIGARYYTYLSTMALAMEAAGERGMRFIVLDRPNPIGGLLVQGNVLEPAFTSFVGMFPVPMRHGLTAGEFARLVRGEFGVSVDLVVVPLSGWTRSAWYDATGLPWVAPSPNMPDIESAAHYPGTCLFEGTNLSVGRGTDRAFQQIGAPWLDAGSLVDRLSALDLPGVRFETVNFTPDRPGDGKYDAIELRGIRFIVTDRDAYDPARTSVAALTVIRALHADEFTFNRASFDRLAGSDRLREAIESGESAAAIADAWTDDITAFSILREPYLIYR